MDILDVFDEVAELYYKKFGQYFPTMCFAGLTIQNMLEKMRECLEVNKRAEELFELDYKNNLY